MYKFARTTIGDFAIHTSRPDPGQEHHKRFAAGVTPHNQWTLNLYTAGRFEIEIPETGYRREMTAGSCSLDIELPSFPQGLCIERCLEPESERLCISPIEPGRRWSRHTVELQAGSAFVAPTNHLMVVLSGVINTADRALQPGSALLLCDGIVLRSDAPARAALMIAM